MNISTLGLMKKTGVIITGFDAVGRELKDVKSKLAGIVLARDLSEKSKKETVFLRDKYRSDVKIAALDADMEEIGGVLGKKTGIIAITDDGFWRSVSKDLICF
ncbi:MAG: 50S ribosomal protein L7 [Firmicutes bacterium]|nr:50S ribosomal protein L7 [[Eubacterium] siraeum]MCM1488217.1 50S ribosomal protein L7 [Bacillota bacterium]